MKDAYSFDRNNEGLDISYNKMYEAYTKIFQRCFIDCKPVEADSGAMGGHGSAEFMVKSEIGEDQVVFCSTCTYAANIEKAATMAYKNQKEDKIKLLKIRTPDAKTINEVGAFLKVTLEKIAKTLIYIADGKSVVVVIRGDRKVNETKVVNAIGGVSKFEMAPAEIVRDITCAEVGFAGPIGIKCEFIFVDNEILEMFNFIVGANDTGYHYKNVNYGRDFMGSVGDFRNVEDGDKCPKCGGNLTIDRVIEVGHIFKLGTKYSESMGAFFVDEDGVSKPLIMGCYGIGVNRTMASIIEQHHDENGIIWPLSIAPYGVVIIAAVIKNDEQVKLAKKIYNKLKSRGIEVLLDDRNERTGIKFNDADLIGIPIRITIGKKMIEGKVEFKIRGSVEVEDVDINLIVERVEKEYARN